MKYESKSGMTEFILVLVCVVAIWIIADFVRYAVPSAPIAADMTFVLCCGILVYIVYTRFCARFTYTLADDAVILERKIGKRSLKSRKIPYMQIDKISCRKPKGRPAFGENYTKNIFRKANARYIISNTGEYLVKISADENFLNKLKELTNA